MRMRRQLDVFFPARLLRSGFRLAAWRAASWGSDVRLGAFRLQNVYGASSGVLLLVALGTRACVSGTVKFPRRDCTCLQLFDDEKVCSPKSGLYRRLLKYLVLRR